MNPLSKLTLQMRDIYHVQELNSNVGARGSKKGLAYGLCAL
jgi:hypothetical protein